MSAFDPRKGKGLAGLLVVACLVSGAYLLWSARTFALGFPLDDAWIHQTYARNLAARLEWAFVSGTSSGGSTAPLWTAALSVGHRLGLDPRWWAYALGIVLLALTARTCAGWLARRGETRPLWLWACAGLVLVEWHLVWAGLSGMETLALALVAVAVLSRIDARDEPDVLLGMLVGLGAWLRPDSLTLVLPILWAAAFRKRRWSRARVRGLMGCGVGLAAGFVPYLAFNHAVSGAWWPSTFYAKQAEYGILVHTPLFARLASQFEAPLVGAGALLLPGTALVGWRAARAGRWDRLAPLVWAAAFLTTYALRLPVTYQHGRYAMPVIPVLLVTGTEGMAAWADLGAAAMLHRLFSRTWALSAAGAALVFLALGGRAYAQDVAIIETEMVAAARWVSVYTEPGALIAAHDIGALGYFGGRPIVDLAGLASPEVIPFIRDERRLAAYLDAKGARYLMTFPSWYPQLTASAMPVFRTQGRFSPQAGGENMAVYRWGTALVWEGPRAGREP
jgi:hypothetical protein